MSCFRTLPSWISSTQDDLSLRRILNTPRPLELSSAHLSSLPLSSVQWEVVLNLLQKRIQRNYSMHIIPLHRCHSFRRHQYLCIETLVQDIAARWLVSKPCTFCPGPPVLFMLDILQTVCQFIKTLVRDSAARGLCHILSWATYLSFLILLVYKYIHDRRC